MSKADESALEPTLSRKERAEQIEIVDVHEIRDGAYRVKAINDSGTEKTILAMPGDLMSSSEDMMYRGDDGTLIGKYLIALAEYDDEYTQELLQGIESRQEALEDDIETLNTKVRRKSETIRTLERVKDEV